MSSTGISALQRSALQSILAAGALLVALLAAAAALAGIPQRAVLKTVLVAACGAALLVKALPAHSPHRRFGIANQITLLRAVLVALLAGTIGEGSSSSLAQGVTVVAAVAALLDALDGYLARRLGLVSAYGARFDMETDAVLVLVLSVLAWQLQKAAPWVLVSGLLRYGFVLAGLLWPRLARPLPPSARRRLIAALQMVLLIAALSPLLPRPYSDFAAGLAVVTLLASFGADVRTLCCL
jgi:phosphatidylglycerophosphate synthase